MPQPKSLLDTDILSAVLRGELKTTAAARAYLDEHGALSFSIITRYEILRGLKAKEATAQLRSFDQLCDASLILPLTDEIVVKAADLYAMLRRRGQPTGDADLLIAASALTYGMAVVTNNEDHFQRVPGLQVANWLKT